jgi:hypothetical protein
MNGAAPLIAAAQAVSRPTGERITTLAIEIVPVFSTPHGELVRVYVDGDNVDTLGFEATAASLGLGKPLVIGPREFVTVLKQPDQPGVIAAPEPNHGRDVY